MKKKMMMIFMGLLLIVFLTACDEEAPEEESENGEVEEEEELGEPEANYGGTLRLAVAEVAHGNPIYENPEDMIHIQQLIFESLVTFDEDLSIIGEIAKDWSFSEDGQVVELELNSEVMWHDGEPFTVEDIEFTVNAIKNAPSESISHRIYQNSVKHISAVREMENGNARISFTRPFSNALEALTFSILPKHIFEENPELLTGEDFPWIGTGPYMLDEMGEEGFTLRKSEDHYRTDPFIEAIDVRIIEDYKERKGLFEEGELDLFRSTYLDLEDHEGSEERNVHAFLRNHVEFLAFNFDGDSVFAGNKDVRRVFAQGINKEQLIEEIYFGYGQATETPIHREHWLYNERLSEDEGTLEEEEIQEIMENLGYQFGEEGLWVDNNGDSLTVEILVNENHGPRVMAAEVIKEQLLHLGFDITLAREDFNSIQQRLDNGNYELYFGAWELAFLPDLSFAFHSDFAGRSNFMDYRDGAMDEMLEDTFRTPTPEEKKDRMEALQAMIHEELPIISLYFLQDTYLSGESLHGYLQLRGNNIFANLDEWFIETK